MECKTADKTSQSTFTSINIGIGGKLDRRERVILFNSARSCEIAKMLSEPIDFNYHMKGNHGTV